MNIFVVGSHAVGEQNSRLGVANAIAKVAGGGQIATSKTPQEIYKRYLTDESYRLWPDNFPEMDRDTVKGIPKKFGPYAKELIAEHGEPDIIIHSGGYERGIKLALALKLANKKPTFLVNLTDPRTTDYDIFDLVVNPASGKARAQDFSLDGVAHKVTQEKIDDGVAEWQDRLSEVIKHPRIVAVLVGGTIPNRSGDLVFSEEDGRALGECIREVALTHNAAVIATNSRRTPDKAWQAFAQELNIPDIPMLLHNFKRDDEHNPYFAMLGVAHLLVVTADSRSMLWEVSETGKPAYAFVAPHQQLEPIHVRNLENLVSMGMTRELPTDPIELDFEWKPRKYNPTSDLAYKILTAYFDWKNLYASPQSNNFIHSPLQ